jgi:hypothetical protein
MPPPAATSRTPRCPRAVDHWTGRMLQWDLGNKDWTSPPLPHFPTSPCKRTFTDSFMGLADLIPHPIDLHLTWHFPPSPSNPEIHAESPFDHRVHAGEVLIISPLLTELRPTDAHRALLSLPSHPPQLPMPKKKSRGSQLSERRSE